MILRNPGRGIGTIKETPEEGKGRGKRPFVELVEVLGGVETRRRELENIPRDKIDETLKTEYNSLIGMERALIRELNRRSKRLFFEVREIVIPPEEIARENERWWSRQAEKLRRRIEEAKKRLKEIEDPGAKGYLGEMIRRKEEILRRVMEAVSSAERAKATPEVPPEETEKPPEAEAPSPEVPEASKEVPEVPPEVPPEEIEELPEVEAEVPAEAPETEAKPKVPEASEEVPEVREVPEVPPETKKPSIRVERGLSPELMIAMEEAESIFEEVKGKFEISPVVMRRVEEILRERYRDLMYEYAAEYFSKKRPRGLNLRDRDMVMMAAERIGLFGEREFLEAMEQDRIGKRMVQFGALLGFIKRGEIPYPYRVLVMYELDKIGVEREEEIEKLFDERKKLGFLGRFTRRKEWREINEKIIVLRKKQSQLRESMDNFARGIIGETITERAKREKKNPYEIIEEIAHGPTETIKALYQEAREELAARTVEEALRAERKTQRQLEEIKMRFGQRGQDPRRLIQVGLGIEEAPADPDAEETEEYFRKLLEGFGVDVPPGAFREFNEGREKNKRYEVVAKTNIDLLRFLFEFIFWLFIKE